MAKKRRTRKRGYSCRGGSDATKLIGQTTKAIVGLGALGVTANVASELLK